AFTRQLVDIESITGNESEVGDFLYRELSRANWQAKKLPVEGDRQNIYATPSQQPQPAIVFSTHMDTVPPFIPSSEDATCVYGRGSCDAKGIIAAQIADLGFVAGNRFDVDELPGECDDVHGREHNRCCRQCNLDSVSTSDSHIKSLFLDGPAGRLEALLNGGAANATHAALVCHPHPIYGGTLHNKVVFHTAKALNSFGYQVLRLIFAARD